MTRIFYKRRRVPSAVIQHAVWLYFRFTLSLRDVEEMLAYRSHAGRAGKPVSGNHTLVVDEVDIGVFTDEYRDRFCERKLPAPGWRPESRDRGQKRPTP